MCRSMWPSLCSVSSFCWVTIAATRHWTCHLLSRYRSTLLDLEADLCWEGCSSTDAPAASSCCPSSYSLWWGSPSRARSLVRNYQSKRHSQQGIRLRHTTTRCVGNKRDTSYSHRSEKESCGLQSSITSERSTLVMPLWCPSLTACEVCRGRHLVWSYDGWWCSLSPSSTILGSWRVPPWACSLWGFTVIDDRSPLGWTWNRFTKDTICKCIPEHCIRLLTYIERTLVYAPPPPKKRLAVNC